MTREEAIKSLKGLKARCERLIVSSGRNPEEWRKDAEAVNIAISALHSVSREQVEQIKGVWIFNDDWWEFLCSECHKGIGNIEKYKFCPHCGAPMTDEAVEMVMERLEVLYNA